MIWRLGGGALDEAARVRPILEEFEALPGFSPARYDLNQHGSWRSFDVEKACVDALAQRTQLVRVEGRSPGQVAMVAMGKHGEQPTVMVQLRVEIREGAAEVAARWPGLFERAPLLEALVTSPSWRAALVEVGAIAGAQQAHPGAWHAWAPDREPAGLEELAPPLERRAHEACVIWALGGGEGLEEPARVEAIRQMGQRLL